MPQNFTTIIVKLIFMNKINTLKYFIVFLLYFNALNACKNNNIEENCNETEKLQINQIQIIASHNSYRLKTYEPIYEFIIGLNLTGSLNPKELDYTHEPILEQLNTYKVHGLELDIYHDPTGGRFYNRLGNTVVGEPAESNIPELLEPGFKILHIPDLDFMTHFYTFKAALQAIKTWSKQNPTHLPLFINIEAKTESLANFGLNVGATTLPITPAALDSIDLEIKQIFGENLDGIITPNIIKGNYNTLNDAVKNKQLPTIEQARGKIFFILDGHFNDYAQNHPSLQQRAMFVYAPPRVNECAFIIANDSKSELDSIKQWVKEGYMVRTRADAGTIEARKGDYSAMNAAFESGAQIISTDYYRPDTRYLTDTAWTNFTVKFENGKTVQLNTINNNNVNLQNCFIE